jgi:peptide-methionine (R)-S-oxide reductase
MKHVCLALLALSLVTLGCDRSTATAADTTPAKPGQPTTAQPATQDASVGHVEKSDEEWKKILTPEQYNILRKKGTEPSGTGAYVNNHEKGTYLCAACGLELFSSDTKFESGTGWPSFWQPIARTHVTETTDRTYGMNRTEVTCARCGGHLGHVFDDGPKPTGLRYCMNSASLKFVPAKDASKGAEKK